MEENRENSGRCSSASATSSYSLSESAMFSQRIVNVDFYSAAPIRDMDVIYSKFRGYEVKRVPVIRIFGATSKGQKTCTHVHCVFPYFYVPFDATVPNLEYRLAIELDQAINLSIGTKDAKNVQHVFKIIKVTGKSFYGYKGSNDIFLKIYFYNPWLVKKAVELLQNGTILDRKFQPFEAHIPYILQFMIDYSLYGMNLIHFSSVKFRLGGDKKSRFCTSPTSYHEPFTVRGGQKVWDLSQIPEYLCVPSSVEKMSKCDLEVDVLGSDILIADSQSGVRSSNPGIDAIWMDEVERRRQEEVENWSQITIPESQNRSLEKKRFPTEENYFQKLLFNMNESKKYEKEMDTSVPSVDFSSPSPSSQLQNHTPSNLPFAQEVRLTSTHIQSSRDDEDLLNLLLDLANEKEREEQAEEIGSSLGSQIVDVEEPHVNLDEDEHVENAEEIWNESFISNTFIEECLDAAGKQLEANNANGKPWGGRENSDLAQLDGQDDSDDSDEDKNKNSKERPRRSTRISSGNSTLDKKIKKKFLYPTSPKSASATVSAKISAGKAKKSAAAKLIELVTSPKNVSPKNAGTSNVKSKIAKETIQIESLSPPKTPPTVTPSTYTVSHRSSPRLSVNNRPGNDNEKKENVAKRTLNLRSTKLTTKLTAINPPSKKIMKMPRKSKLVIENLSPNKHSKQQDSSELVDKSLTTVKDQTEKDGETMDESKRIEKESTADKVLVKKIKRKESSIITEKSPIIEESSRKISPVIPETTEDVGPQKNVSVVKKFPKKASAIIRKTTEDAAPQKSASIIEVSPKKANQVIGKTPKHLGALEKIEKTTIKLIPETTAKDTSLEKRLVPEKSSIPQNHQSLENASTKPQMEKESNTKQLDLTSKENSVKTVKTTELIATQQKSLQINVPMLNEDALKSFKNKLQLKRTFADSNAASSPDSDATSAKQTKVELKKRNEKIARPKSVMKKQNLLPLKKVGTPIRRSNAVTTSSNPIANSGVINDIESITIIDISDYPDDNAATISETQKTSLAASSGTSSAETTSEYAQNDFHVLLQEKLKEIKETGRSPTESLRRLTDDYLDNRGVRPSTVARQRKAASSRRAPSLIDSNCDPDIIIEKVVHSNKSSATTTPAKPANSTKQLPQTSGKERRNLNSQSGNNKFAKATTAVSCQTDNESQGIEVSIQTELPQKESSSQTELFVTDAICQTNLTTATIFGVLCKCYSGLERIFKDQAIDIQADLVQTQTKKLQIEMGDILAEMRKSGDRFINSVGTSTGNQSVRTPTSASTIISDKCNELGTPKSSKKNFNKPTTPSSLLTVQKTSPRRVSPNSNLYEKYVTSRTPSPRKHFFKQPNSSPASMRRRISPGTPTNTPSYSIRRPRLGSARLSGKIVSPRKSLNKRFEQTDFNSSITSVYEYHGSTPENDEVEDDFQNLSKFQRRRSETKARNINRVQSKRAKYLNAFKLAPDISEWSFEPMKIAPSYKALDRWAHTKGKHRAGEAMSPNHNSNVERIKPKVKESESTGNSSDEESIENVRRVGGGNLSDEEDDDCLDAPVTNVGNTSIISQSPLLSSQELSQSQNSCSSSQSAPRSILKSKNPRRFSEKAKRTIRWDDEGTARSVTGGELRKEAILNAVNAATVSSFAVSPSTSSWVANISELDGPSPKNLYGFEHNMSNLQDAQALHMHQYLTTFCVEIHCDSIENFVPNPHFDAIQAIFIYMNNDFPDEYDKPSVIYYHLIVDPQKEINTTVNPLLSAPNVVYFADEISMMNGFVQIVHKWDPDIFVGFEIQKQSIGYIIERGMELKMNMLNELSRIRPTGNYQGTNNDRVELWNETIPGRIVLNLWRLLRHEITVQSYTYENAAYHILHRRVHLFSYKQLTSYWNDLPQRRKVIAFYHERTKGAIEMIEKLDIINRNSELARLFGIQFYEVLSRGSQFRVESMMLRISKPRNYIPASPSMSQRAKMKAPEFLPLILEPHSNFYTDPVAVLDFQSLYPSMMIAYNYDYATCLGRVENLGKSGFFEMGCLDQSVKLSDLEKLKNNIHISPAGVAFVDTSIRKGILPEMLEQILETRQMVKRAMKRWKGQGDSLKKILDYRQLGLKLIANVTYGYTSANFSGRMPCVDIADSVVSKGRETLQRAIDHVKSNFHRWGGDVVYGDTDSLFVRFKEKTREEAFVMAQQIVDEVTQANPKPVKLKLEKVYQPCILQSKKRYVGYMYETPDQKEPTYEAKGIETVRRDGCPAVKKILEKTLHTLFTTKDVAKVKHYVESQFSKIFIGRVSLSDFTLAREYRGRSGYKPGACVPSLEISKKIIQTDPRAEPLPSQRVPYVIVYGNPSLPLIKLVQTPLEFVNNPSFRLNAHYYIEKMIIPALNRCLILANMDASKWYKALPRKYLRCNSGPKDVRQVTLAHYFSSSNCLRCDANTYNTTDLCDTCRDDGLETVLFLQNKCFHMNNKYESTQKICFECSEATDKCVSTDCPIFHKLVRYKRDDETFNRNYNLLKSFDW